LSRWELNVENEINVLNLNTYVLANCTHFQRLRHDIFDSSRVRYSTFRIIVLRLPTRCIRGIANILAKEGQKSCDSVSLMLTLQCFL
jgi:hypothetical protein